MRRETNREAPTGRLWVNDKGKSIPGAGARDAMVWLAALDAAKISDGPVYLVSQDSSAFRDGDQLRAELQAEADREAGKGKLILFAGLLQMLEQMAPARDLDHITAVVMAEHELTWVAVDEQFRGAAAQSWDVMIAAFGTDNAPGYFANYTEPVLVESPTDLKSYRVEDLNWVTFRSTWESIVTFGAEHGASYHLAVRAEMTILAQLDVEEKTVVWAEVLDSRSLTPIGSVPKPAIVTVRP